MGTILFFRNLHSIGKNGMLPNLQGFCNGILIAFLTNLFLWHCKAREAINRDRPQASTKRNCNLSTQQGLQVFHTGLDTNLGLVPILNRNVQRKTMFWAFVHLIGLHNQGRSPFILRKSLKNGSCPHLWSLCTPPMFTLSICKRILGLRLKANAFASEF